MCMIQTRTNMTMPEPPPDPMPLQRDARIKDQTRKRLQAAAAGIQSTIFSGPASASNPQKTLLGQSNGTNNKGF